MTIDDILNIDIRMFNKLDKKELKDIVSQMGGVISKRIKTFREHDESSPAVRQLMRSGGLISVKGKDLNALRSEFVRAKNFLNSNTGTLSKWNKVKDNTISGLQQYNINVSRNNFDDIWRLYEQMKEISPDVAMSSLKYKIIEQLSELVKDDMKNDIDIINELTKKLGDIYEQQERERNDLDSFSNFFEF